MMEKIEIKKYNSILSVFGLVFLLLISPCKVRNFIQSELGVPQTTVSNKSQTTLTTASCVAFDVIETNHSSFSTGTKILDNFVSQGFLTFYISAHLKIKKYARISKSKLIPSLPLYILFLNFQVYS